MLSYALCQQKQEKTMLREVHAANLCRQWTLMAENVRRVDGGNLTKQYNELS